MSCFFLFLLLFFFFFYFFFFFFFSSRRRHTRLVSDWSSDVCSSDLVLIMAGAALATTVIPPSFDDLVGRAEMIFQGTVTGVRSEWTGEGAQRHIMSYVTVKVEETIKGKIGRASCRERV